MNNEFGKEDFIPKEYQETLRNLFPANQTEGIDASTLKALEDFANALDVGVEYKKCFFSQEACDILLDHFQKNIVLLITKTWVEEGDEYKKAKLYSRIHVFVKKMKQEFYDSALPDFCSILSELAFLFFGMQSKKDDLLEYAFRIDTQLGLFCWFSKRLVYVSQTEAPESLRAYLLLGICYLKTL